MKVDWTEVAKEELKKVMETRKEDKCLRIYIAGYGWGGPSFGMALDELKEGDTSVTQDDFTFVVEEDLVDTFNHFTIDYSNNWLRKGFTVTPDRKISSC